MGEAKIYVIPGSHPSWSAMLMLDRKGIPFKRVDLMPVISKGVLKAQRFPGVTVPALKIDGRRVQGSREIARELTISNPILPSSPRTRRSESRSRTLRRGATSSSRSRAGSAGGRSSATARRWRTTRRVRGWASPVGLAVKTGGRTPPVFPPEWLEGLKA